MARRVVITGVGSVNSLGKTVHETWYNIIAAKSGISVIDRFDMKSYPSKIGGVIRDFTPETVIAKQEIRRQDLFMQYGLYAAHEAIKDSGWEPTTQEELDMTGVYIGSGIGGLQSIENNAVNLYSLSKRLSPFFIPSCLINLLSGYVSMKYGFTGPNSAVATACATGTHSIGDAARIIKYGDADIMITGGAESPITPLGVAGFAAARTLSTGYNDLPTKASRPWDKDRDGFVISEGAAILVLEEYEHAKRRNAKIYAEILGYGMSGDAHHITAPHSEGRGAKRAMIRAINDARINPADIDYINAHGTSTSIGDEIELNSVQSIFYDHNKNIKMSSTKSAIGHLLGAAGAVECILTCLAIKDQVAPATLNLDNPIDSLKINLVPHEAQDTKIDYAISNSFGFGGTNASIVLKRV